MVEIECPYCGQEYERNDLVDMSDQPASIAPGQVTIDDEPLCGHPLSGDAGNCTRTVENPGDKCWQHEENDD